MRPMKDPAPSRLSYRLNRLMLTPRFRRFLHFGLPLLIVAAVGAIWASDEMRRDAFAEQLSELRRQVEERPEFLVHMMTVDGASPEVEADIRRNVPVDFPVSSFDLDLDTVREAIESYDPVARASVRIKGGGVLAVSIDERVPLAVFRQPNGLSLLDGAGHRVTSIDARTDRPDLPLLLGLGADREMQQALAILDAAEPIAPRIRGLRRVGERRWDLLLDRDQRVMLPEAAPLLAMERVMALNAAQDLLARDVEVVDYRNPSRPVLRLSDTAVDALMDTGLRVYGVETQ